MNLRDHDRTCEHDNGDPIQSFRFGHIVIGTPGGHWCPGGRIPTRQELIDTLGATETHAPNAVWKDIE